MGSLLTVFVTILSFQVQAYFEPAQNRDAPSEMNGIKFEGIPNFTKDDQLISVRYRTDSGEMRIIYANEIAAKALQDLKPNYPDGAMFIKVGIATEDDPAFVSSKIPSGARRLQVMLKDKKRYADTDGWGYALFDPQGKIFLDEPVAQKTLACAACHRLVPERDYVFSRRAAFDFRKGLNDSPLSQGKLNLTFKTSKRAQLPPNVVNLVKDLDNIDLLEGDLQKNKFSGTLDEIVPMLVEQAFKNNSAAALIFDEENFSLVKYSNKKKLCANPKQLALHVWIEANGKFVRDANICK